MTGCCAYRRRFNGFLGQNVVSAGVSQKLSFLRDTRNEQISRAFSVSLNSRREGGNGTRYGESNFRSWRNSQLMSNEKGVKP
jgi:hypothetical protein